MSRHPAFPRSNVSKFSGYDPEKYELKEVSFTTRTAEELTPGQSPRLTQESIGKYLKPITKELAEVPPRPYIDELPEAVIDNMVLKDKAFWVDKPGANAYTLHDAYYNYGMTTEIVKPPHQDVFPRSYQYDLDCVKYRRLHACDAMKEGTTDTKKPIGSHCRPCGRAITFDPNTTKTEQKRWRYYPDLTAKFTPEEIRTMMIEVGRPFRDEACNWYYKNYPSQKYNCIMRKFSK